jgi:hypothetical protein
MFKNIMSQYQGNSLHWADVEELKDVKNKSNQSGSRSRRSSGADGKQDKNQTDGSSKLWSGDSRENDNLEELMHSDHDMNGTGERF